MMYTELYSFEGTAATDAKKTASILKKAKPDSKKLLQKRGGAIETIGSFLHHCIIMKAAARSGSLVTQEDDHGDEILHALRTQTG